MGFDHHLAIDLGTCHTVAVVRRGDAPPRAVLFDGSPLLSSGIYADVTGEIFVGRDAERMSQLDPSRFEPFPKRRIDDGQMLLGETELAVTDALAALLRRVVGEARQTGVDPSGATVLTCPADWGPQRRSLLLTAASAAGLGPVELVDEPIAAASYCEEVLHQQIPPGECLAVFDFGGGTLDIAVVRRESSGLRVLAVGGLDDLGGLDFDAALVGHLGRLVELRNPQAWRRLSQPSTPAEQRDRRTFWSEVRAAKEMLSRTAVAPVSVAGSEEAIHLTREEFDRVAGPLVDRAVDEMRRVLQRAGFTGPGLDGSGSTAAGGAGGASGNRLAGIFLVGGSSRVPLVASRLHQRFAIAPTVPEQPELPVAYGALVAARAGAAAGATAGAAPTSPPPVASGVPASGLPLPGTYPPGPAGSGPSVQPPWAPLPMPMPTSPASGPPTQQAVPPVSGPPTFQPTPPVSGPPAPPWAARPDGLWAGARPGGPVKDADPLVSPKRRRPHRWRYVATAMAVVISAGLAFSGRALSDAIGTFSDKITNGGGDVFGAGGPGLSTATVKLAGDQAATFALDADTVYTAVAGADKLDVTATPITGGNPRWAVTVPAEPASVTMIVTSGLLVIDGSNADTHGGESIRAVLDAKTGASRWLAAWPQRRDVAYLGTDVLIQQQTSGKTSLARIDLLTGKPKWQHAAVNDTATTDEWLSHAVVTWPADDQQVAAPSPDRPAFTQRLALDGTIAVQVGDAQRRGEVITTADGKTKVTGVLPLDPTHWTVFDSLAIGKSSATPNWIEAYGLGDLKKTWQYQLPAGASVERIGPCGQHTVCVAGTANAVRTIVAINTADGKERWKHTAESLSKSNTMVRPGWLVIGDVMLVGEALGDCLTGAGAVDATTGTVRYHLDKGGAICASSPTRIAHRTTAVSMGGTVKWQVTAADPVSRKNLGKITVGSAMPEQVAMSSAALGVRTKDRRVLVARLPGQG